VVGAVAVIVMVLLTEGPKKDNVPQVTVNPFVVHDQLEPLATRLAKPEGSVSVTVVAIGAEPEHAALPVFVTVMVNVTVPLTWTDAGVAVLLMDRLHRVPEGVTESGMHDWLFPLF
jgi:hypothetical protein